MGPTVGPYELGLGKWIYIESAVLGLEKIMSLQIRVLTSPCFMFKMHQYL